MDPLEAVEREILPYEDFLLATLLLEKNGLESSAVLALLCHLSLSIKQGNLGLLVQEECLSPSVELLWKNEESEIPVFSPTEKKSLEALILKGAKEVIAFTVALKKPFYGIVYQPLKSVSSFKKEAFFFYFQKTWLLEKQVKDHLHVFLTQEPSLVFSKHLLLERLEKEKELFKEQKLAIQSIFFNRLTLLIGGPGTGKTYTAAKALQLFWELLAKEAKGFFQIALAAPTGKAAVHLMSVLKRDAQYLPIAFFGTLHSLLGVGRQKGLEANQGKNRQLIPTQESGYEFSTSPKVLINQQLPYDLILVDESSMIDAHLMASLFSSVKSGSRLVLIGDPYQLPPVGVGHLFADLTLKNKQVVKLETCLRAELKEIVLFSKAIQQGNSNEVFSIFDQKTKGVKERFLDEKALFEDALSRFDLRWDTKMKQEMQFFKPSQFALLTPFRKGPFGLEQINKKIFSKLLESFSIGQEYLIPLLIVKNAPQWNLFNGDRGFLLIEKQAFGFLKKTALFFYDKEIKEVSPYFLPKYEWAFCLSVHKSQGSEFERVHLLLPPGSAIFGREVFYTGVTRAKKYLEVWSDRTTITQTLTTATYRLSSSNL